MIPAGYYRPSFDRLLAKGEAEMRINQVQVQVQALKTELPLLKDYAENCLYDAERFRDRFTVQGDEKFEAIEQIVQLLKGIQFAVFRIENADALHKQTKLF